MILIGKPLIPEIRLPPRRVHPIRCSLRISVLGLFHSLVAVEWPHHRRDRCDDAIRLRPLRDSGKHAPGPGVKFTGNQEAQGVEEPIQILARPNAGESRGRVAATSSK
jgi:hypothetical protein